MRGAAALAAAAVIAGGCASTKGPSAPAPALPPGAEAPARREVKPLTETRLVMTRSGADVHLEWESDARFVYSVFFSDELGRGTAWRPLAGAQNLRGTGAKIVLSDQVDPSVRRYYRVHTAPLPR